LETYEKGPGYIKLSISCDHVPVASINHTFTTGIEYIELPSSDILVKGSVIVTDTNGYELPKVLPIQISPLYVNTVNSQVVYPSFKVNDKAVSFKNLNLVVSGLFTYSVAGSVADISITEVIKEVDVKVSEDSYISHVNGKPVVQDDNGVGYAVVPLPSYFKIKASSDNSTLYMTGNTENTCPVYNVSNPEIPLNYTKNTTYQTPLDVCVQNNLFDPMVIDEKTFTSEKLKWDSLSPRHDTGVKE
jgi:hypothetical protein